MKTPPALQLTAVYEPATEGGYTCTFGEFPDVFLEGETLEEAESNLFDALQIVLNYHRETARSAESPEHTVRHQFQLAPA